MPKSIYESVSPTALPALAAACKNADDLLVEINTALWDHIDADLQWRINVRLNQLRAAVAQIDCQLALPIFNLTEFDNS